MLIKEQYIHPYVRQLLNEVGSAEADTEQIDALAGCGAIGGGSLVIFSLLMVYTYYEVVSVLWAIGSLLLFGLFIAYLHSAWQRHLQQRQQVAISKLLRRARDRHSALQTYLLLLRDLSQTPRNLPYLSQTILQQANELMDCALRLERLSELYRLPALPPLQEEKLRLEQEIAATHDAVAKQTLEESLRLLTKRLEVYHQRQTYLQRTKAMQELVLQMLASLHDSLYQWQNLPQPHSPSELEVLYERMREIQTETTALEKAVQELHPPL